MTQNDRNTIIKQAEEMASDIFKAAGKNNETLLLLVENLYRYGEKRVDAIEREKGIQGKIACKKGCDHCCYAQVSLTPPEAFLIVQCIKNTYSLKKRDALMKRVTGNLRLTQDKSIDERIDVWQQTPCIFLENGACSIYNVRPLICRAWHSLSADQCLKAFHSGDKNAEIDSTPYRNAIYGAIREGLVNACETIGLTCNPFVITRSIKTILNHPAPDEAWFMGEFLFDE